MVHQYEMKKKMIKNTMRIMLKKRLKAELIVIQRSELTLIVTRKRRFTHFHQWQQFLLQKVQDCQIIPFLATTVFTQKYF